MSTVVEGLLIAAGKRFGIVASRFNELISKKLLEGAIDCLIRHNGRQRKHSHCLGPGRV